jgi:hypothetical protein
MVNSIFSEIFERSKTRKELIGIWRYEDDGGFLCGYVINYDENLVAIKHYTKFGKPDGVIIEQITNIASIDTNHDYTISMQYIIANSKKLDKDFEIDIEMTGGELWQFKVLQENSDRKDRIVSVEINGEEHFCGFVGKVTMGDFELKCIGKLGEDEGIAVYKTEDVTSVRINDLDSRKRLLLFNWKGSLMAQ